MPHSELLLWLSLLLLLIATSLIDTLPQQLPLATNGNRIINGTSLSYIQQRRRHRRQLLPFSSQYTRGNVYDILTVSMLAGLGAFLIPNLSTFLTYIVASNRNLLFPKSKRRRRFPTPAPPLLQPPTRTNVTTLKAT